SGELFQGGGAWGFDFRRMKRLEKIPDDLRENNQREESREPIDGAQRRAGARHDQAKNSADEYARHEQAEADGESDIGAHELEHGDSAFEYFAIEREHEG